MVSAQQDSEVQPERLKNAMSRQGEEVASLLAKCVLHESRIAS
jgi:hypothetical protein